MVPRRISWAKPLLSIQVVAKRPWTLLCLNRRHRRARKPTLKDEIQRQGAKPPRRNRILFITKPGNQESPERGSVTRSRLANQSAFGLNCRGWNNPALLRLPEPRSGDKVAMRKDSRRRFGAVRESGSRRILQRKPDPFASRAERGSATRSAS